MLFVLTYNKKVVHIPSIVFLAQRAFHKLVERIQIDIAEKLRGEVAMGRPRPLGT